MVNRLFVQYCAFTLDPNQLSSNLASLGFAEKDRCEPLISTSMNLQPQSFLLSRVGRCLNLSALSQPHIHSMEFVSTLYRL